MKGYFGEFGGQYVPETLLPALEELESAMEEAFADTAFRDEFTSYLVDYVGRPTPLTHAKRLSEHFGCEVWLKREDLNHTLPQDQQCHRPDPSGQAHGQTPDHCRDRGRPARRRDRHGMRPLRHGMPRVHGQR